MVGMVAAHAPHPDSWTGLLGVKTSGSFCAAATAAIAEGAAAARFARRSSCSQTADGAAPTDPGADADGDIGYKSDAKELPAALGPLAAAKSSTAYGREEVKESEVGSEEGDASGLADEVGAAGCEEMLEQARALDEDGVLLDQLSLAETLLEAAVHSLLAIGRDSTRLLYGKLCSLMGPEAKHLLQVGGSGTGTGVRESGGWGVDSCLWDGGTRKWGLIAVCGTLQCDKQTVKGAWP